MWRKACPWSTGVLAVALILVTWRLRAVETELDRVRDQLAAATTGRVPGSNEEAAMAAGVSAAAPGDAPDMAGRPPDMSSEWEQAVPPMDS